MTEIAEADLSDDDMDALRKCMEIAKRDPLRVEQLESMLEDRPWIEVARFACYCVQGDVLRLKLWESPPCSPSDDEAAWKLLQKMLKAGVSRFDPDPLRALEAAQAEKGRKTKSRKSMR
jgi:hypothetical protein